MRAGGEVGLRTAMEVVDAAVEMGPKNRTPHDMLEESRAAMEDLAAKMLFIKKEGRPKSDLRELITQMSLIFITLRQVLPAPRPSSPAHPLPHS